jgi:hypothetical protein
MNQNRRLSGREERHHSGLPTADDYLPEALGSAEFRAGDAQQEWEQFGIELVPIQFRSRTQEDWQDTGRRVVNRNGKYIDTVSDRYQLLPNERAVEAANEAARQLGAEPFHEWERPDDDDGGWFIELDDHVFQDGERRRVHALYAWDSAHWEDEPIEYGFVVHNSIDKSTPFKVGLFSYRHACANMVMMDVNKMPENIEAEREVLASSSHRHTSSLEVDIDGLVDRIKASLFLVDQIDESYRRWRDEVVDYTQVESLLKTNRLATSDMPGWIQELKDDFDEAAETAGDDDEADWDDLDDSLKASLTRANLPESETTWDTYNSLTETIWHSGSTNDQTKQKKFGEVHSAIQPAQGVR